MQPTLLAIAKADLKTAKHLVGSSDKFQKHQAAYFTQQAVEKTIKYVISQKTGSQPWGHDISKLIVIAKKEEIEIPEEIIKNAALYTSWEVVTRYYPTAVIRRDSISKSIRTIEQWQKSLR